CVLMRSVLPALFASTHIYNLSLHAALPISSLIAHQAANLAAAGDRARGIRPAYAGVRCAHQTADAIVAGDHRCGVGSTDRSTQRDRKSTRLNSSHGKSPYAVFCLKTKRQTV